MAFPKTNKAVICDGKLEHVSAVSEGFIVMQQTVLSPKQSAAPVRQVCPPHVGTATVQFLLFADV